MSVVDQLEEMKRYNLQKPARLAQELGVEQRKLHEMQFALYSRMLRSNEEADRERAITGLSAIKQHWVVSLLAEHLAGESDLRLREKILDAIESRIILPAVGISFTQMRNGDLPSVTLAVYAMDLANNYQHTLIAA